MGKTDLPDEDMLLNPIEAAILCKCSRATMYARADDRTIPHYRISAKPGKRGKLIFRKTDLLKWLESCRVEGSA